GPLWSCPRLELPRSWDVYLATLSANRRQILRRKERSLFRDHAAAVVDYGEDRLDEGWGHLLRLHEQRWDGAGGGAFRDPRSERLQRGFRTFNFLRGDDRYKPQSTSAGHVTH